MKINKNSNITKALNVFKIEKIDNNLSKDNSTSDPVQINYLMDELTESQYITRNYQIGITYVQIAKSTLSQVKKTIIEMKEIFDKCKNENNTSFGRESLNFKFEELRQKFNENSNKLSIDIRENLFYNSKNELVFKVFDSKSLENCILIPKLDANKLNLKDINIKNEINANQAYEKITEVLDYIISSEKEIKNSEEKLLKVNLTDIMSANLMALSSNESKESIQKLLDLTRKGLLKEGNTYLKDLNKDK